MLAEDPRSRDRSALASALRALGAATDPRVVAVEPLAAAGRIAVDLEARLPGGGSLLLSAQAVRLPDGTWRVAWFQTPSGSWPARRAASGEGLTSSAPPR